jgi:hypothetical protein
LAYGVVILFTFFYFKQKYASLPLATKIIKNISICYILLLLHVRCAHIINNRSNAIIQASLMLSLDRLF